MKSNWFERRHYALGTWTALCGLAALVNPAGAQTGYGQAAPALAWQAVAASADGNLLLAAPTGAWPLPPPPASPSPLLSIAQSGANPFLSWVVPSTRFILQQSSDLSSPNWTDVTNQPTLNLTNLRNEVTLPGSSGHAFYRLKQQ